MQTKSLMAIALLGTIGGACSASNQIGSELPGDGGMVCRGSGLSPTCPATWEDAQTVACGAKVAPPVQSSWLGHSEGLLLRAVSTGGQWSYCLYDPATHAAVGGWRTSYVADFCSETSRDIYYGVAAPGRDYSNDIGVGPQCPDYGMCRKPLSESTCPPTWPEAQVEPSLCTLSARGPVLFGHAAGLLVRSVAQGVTTQSCYYDPMTFALVGEWTSGGPTVVVYCDGTSYDVLYGDVVSSGIPFKPDLGEPSCPDGGASS